MILGCDTNDTVIIKIQTKTYGGENSWYFGPCSSSQKYESYKEYTAVCCLNPAAYDLICKNSAGDGWEGGFIEIQGKIYCEDFISGYDITKHVTIVKGKC